MTDGRPAGFTRAYLELFERSAGQTAGPGQQVFFQFNPKEFQVSKKGSWKSSPTRGNRTAPPPEYTGPEPGSMTLEMFLDASDKADGDVSSDVQKLFEACSPTESSSSKDKPLPPGVKFGWDRVYFVGYLESVTAKYTLFRESGHPIRALCTLALKELPKETPRQNPTSGSMAEASYQVIAGDTLPGIAYREMGDARLWRELAESNRIDDPMRLRPGLLLLIPSQSRRD